MDNKILQLIKVVSDNCNCISQLETLTNLLDQHGGYEREAIVAATTMNSRYDYRLFTLPKFQDREMHVDKLVVDDRVAAVGEPGVKAIDFVSDKIDTKTLRDGDILIAKKDVESLGTKLLTKDKEYKCFLIDPDHHSDLWFIDDTGSQHFFDFDRLDEFFTLKEN